MRVLLSDFAGQANGKKTVTINAPNDDAWTIGLPPPNFFKK
jgi:hypothetical protein